MKEKLTSGIAWVMIVTMGSKVLSVISQIVLGYYLAIEDFGIYASALGMTAVFSWLKNGSILQLIIKESVSGGAISKFFKFARYFNIVSSAGLFTLACLYWKDEGYIGFLMLSFAISQFFSLPQLKIRSSFSSSGKFKLLGFYELGQALLNNVTIICLAVFLGDERCFAFSILAITIYDIFIHHFYVKRERSDDYESFSIKDMKYVWQNARWLLLGALGSSMVMQGTFLIIGFWETEITLGLYFFAFQLISVFGVVVGEGVRKVLMPVLSSIKDENDRFDSLSRTLKYCAVFMVPISFGSAIAVDPVIDVIWSGKWADAVIAAQLMAVTLFMPILVLICYSYLEASGYWQIKNVMQVVDGLVLLLLVGIGAIFGGVELIALCAVLRRLISGAFQFYFIFNKIERKKSTEIFKYLLEMCLVSVTITGICVGFIEYFEAGSVIRILTASLAIIMAIAIIFAWKCPQELQAMKIRLRNSKA